MKYSQKATVLVYTLVLVVLGSIFASVSLNIAAELSARYDYNLLTSSLKTIIRDKWDIIMKVARESNANGAGFTDIIWCPDNITLSGATQRATVNTHLKKVDDLVYCKSDAPYYGSDLFIYMNVAGDDISFAEFQWEQISLHSGHTYGQFNDSDLTTLDLWGTSYLWADGIDDDLDSDNYSVSSTGTTLYDQGYYDDDASAQLAGKWYIIKNIGWYNVYWNNYKTMRYIHNAVLETPSYISPANTSSWAIYLDINADHSISYYRYDRSVYNLTHETKVLEEQIWASQSAGIWYLQQDMTLSPTINSNTLWVDFSSQDFAFFIKNESDGILLYNFEAFDVWGRQIYVNPIDMGDEVFSYLWSHILIDQNGSFVTEMIELFWLK